MNIQVAVTISGKDYLTSCDVFVYMYIRAGRVPRLRLRIVDLLYITSTSVLFQIRSTEVTVSGIDIISFMIISAQ